MKIAGIQKTSLIDFPGMLSCVLFCRGCNFRCPFCHNPELVIPERFAAPLDISEINAFLESRKKYLEGVVITGGEPCMNGHSLIEYLKKLKGMGYLVKIDTNGSFPDVLQQAVRERVVDYIAMDIKAPPEKYPLIAGIPKALDGIQESADMIKDSGLAYEFRTTAVKELLHIEDFHAIGRFIRGAEKHFIQKFIPSKTVAPEAVDYKVFSDKEFEEIREIMLKYVGECRIR